MCGYKVEDFGVLPTGEMVHKITFSNSNITVSILDYGAAIQSVRMKGKDGKFEEVTLNYDNINDLLANACVFNGATVGRYANRIAKGQFTLDGVNYQMCVNNGPNSLHGGAVSWGHKIWSFKEYRNTTDDPSVGVTMTIVSPDGDENYPGEMTMSVTFSLNDRDELKLTYEGRTTRRTVVNMTNHTYWNMSGDFKTKIYPELLQVNADTYLPVVDMIPTGERAPVEGTPFDFRQPTRCDQALAIDGGGKPGLDHCYCLNGSGLRLAASVTDVDSGRKLEIFTTEPGIQVYMGNWIDGSFPHLQHNAVALECQHFPDSPNHPDFPTTILNPDEEYHQTTIFKLSLILSVYCQQTSPYKT